MKIAAGRTCYNGHEAEKKEAQMKRTAIVLVLLSVLSSMSFGITLVQKSETTPEFILSGHVWARYTLNYLAEKQMTNQMSISRNYITMKLGGTDYNSNITLDIVNKAGAQTAGDFQVWIKTGYIEFTKLPFLVDVGIKFRAGIQSMYTGTNTTWKYNLYEVPVEGKAGLSSADMGAALIGSALDKMISYELAVYSGDGYTKLDTDKLKALCANVTVKVMDGLNVNMTYYKKAGVTGGNTELNNLAVTEAVVSYTAWPLMDSYAAVIEAVGPKSAGKSGVKQIVSLYAGVKPLDWLSVHARMDIENPDTEAVNDEINQYYAGVLIPIAEKASLLLDYSLKQKRTQITGDKNDNNFVAQIKWDW